MSRPALRNCITKAKPSAAAEHRHSATGPNAQTTEIAQAFATPPRPAAYGKAVCHRRGVWRLHRHRARPAPPSRPRKDQSQKRVYDGEQATIARAAGRQPRSAAGCLAARGPRRAQASCPAARRTAWTLRLGDSCSARRTGKSRCARQPESLEKETMAVSLKPPDEQSIRGLPPSLQRKLREPCS